MKECYETRIVGDGEAALSAVGSFEPDLILLDLMLPGMDGYQVCREVRSSKDTPIIMLSAKGEIFDKVLGLEMGADDYMEKPFDSKELVARVKAVLRRYHKQAPEPADSSDKIVSYPELIINLTSYSVTYKGSRIDMPPKELELLYCLAASPNRVFTSQPDLGLRLRRRYEDGGRPHQADQGEDPRPRGLEDLHDLGHRIQVRDESRKPVKV